MFSVIKEMIVAWEFTSVVIFTILLFGLYMIWLKMNGSHHWEELYTIKSKYKKYLRNYIRDSLSYIHVTCMDNARHHCKDHRQLATFELRLADILRGYLTDAVFVALFENGFEHLDEEDLIRYIDAKGSLLFSLVDEQLNKFGYQYELISNLNDDLIFTEEQGVQVYGDVVRKFLKLKKLEKKELLDIKQRYTVIGFFKHFFKKGKH